MDCSRWNCSAARSAISVMARGSATVALIASESGAYLRVSAHDGLAELVEIDLPWARLKQTPRLTVHFTRDALSFL
jgi:hypothetical protein